MELAPEKDDCPCKAVELLQQIVEGHSKELHNGDVVMARIDERLGRIEDTQQEMKGDIKALKEKPGKRYDNLMTTIINWVAIALLVLAAAKIGLT